MKESGIGKNILIIDDEASIRASLKDALQDEGYSVALAESDLDGLKIIRSIEVDVVLLDIWMPGGDGLSCLKVIKSERPDVPIIMMSGHGTIETAVKSIKLGAFDFIEKPLSLEKLLVLIQNALYLKSLTRENVALRKQVQDHKTIIGKSSAIVNIHRLIERVAPTKGSVLILGENGTGKDLIAHSLHSLSPRAQKPFIEVNCAAIPEELIESDLFGHEKGAFTGATQLKRGRFDLAHGGTIFLDEIGDMSLKTQAKVLRILQEQKFERVGGTQTISVDVRIIAATNKDLKAEIESGSFREDLYYRLNVVPFWVPPLRERIEDIPLLAKHFLREFAILHSRKERFLEPNALEVFLHYPWPGNVRELKNLVERLIILTQPEKDGSPIDKGELSLYLELGKSELDKSWLKLEAWEQNSKKLKEARNEFEKDYILKVLKEHDWNISKSAVALGIERTHLHRKIKILGLEM